MVNSPICRKTFLMTAAFVVAGTGYTSLASAQTSDAKVDQYVSVLNRIADQKLVIAQREAYLANQKNQIASLRAQIKNVGATKKTVGPMIDKMVAAIDAEMNTDLPFKEAERFNRLADVQDTVGDASAPIGEKMRKVLNLYDAELSYGNSVSAYAGDHPKAPGTRIAFCLEDVLSTGCAPTKEVLKAMGYKDGIKLADGPSVSELKDSFEYASAFKDGSYLHYGRLAFIYVHHDSSEAWRYKNDSKEWVQLSGAEVLNARRSVRIAKGEAAPGVITAPLIAIQE